MQGIMQRANNNIGVGHLDLDDNSEQRKEFREQLIGDLLWTYNSDANDNTFFVGTFADDSKSGMSIVTLTPIEEGRLLKLYCEGRWMGARHAAVKWCKKIEPDIYKSGLIINGFNDKQPD
jgi:hypothetical protein